MNEQGVGVEDRTFCLPNQEQSAEIQKCMKQALLASDRSVGDFRERVKPLLEQAFGPLEYEVCGDVLAFNVIEPNKRGHHLRGMVR